MHAADSDFDWRLARSKAHATGVDWTSQVLVALGDVMRTPGLQVQSGVLRPPESRGERRIRIRPEPNEERDPRRQTASASAGARVSAEPQPQAVVQRPARDAPGPAAAAQLAEQEIRQGALPVPRPQDDHFPRRLVRPGSRNESGRTSTRERASASPRPPPACCAPNS